MLLEGKCNVSFKNSFKVEGPTLEFRNWRFGAKYALNNKRPGRYSRLSSFLKSCLLVYNQEEERNRKKKRLEGVATTYTMKSTLKTI